MLQLRALNNKLFIGLLAITFLCGDCDGDWGPNSRFDQPFLKRKPIDLTKVLGDQFAIEYEQTKRIDQGDSAVKVLLTDTINYQITYSQEDHFNSIYDMDDTSLIAKAIVTKHRGLYYFNEERSDSSWSIYAWEIRRDHIKGLDKNIWQLLDMDKAVERGEVYKMVRLFDKENEAYWLTPDKKELHTFFTGLMDTSKAFSIVGWNAGASPVEYQLPDEVQANEADQPTTTQFVPILKSVYPNPAVDHCFIQLNGWDMEVQMELVNRQGQVLKTGRLRHTNNRLDLSKYPDGMYFIRLKTPHQEEVAKVILQRVS